MAACERELRESALLCRHLCLGGTVTRLLKARRTFREHTANPQEGRIVLRQKHLFHGEHLEQEAIALEVGSNALFQFLGQDVKLAI